QAALKQAPGNVDLLVGLGMAERGRDTQSAVEKRQVEEQQRQLAFRKLIDGAKANMAAKQFDAAVSNLTEAQKLSPADREVQALLTEAKQQQAKAGADAQSAAEARKKAEAYQGHIGNGRVALSAKRFDAAIESFKAALAVMPGDRTAADFLKEAEKQKADAAQTRDDAAKKLADADAALKRGRAALAAKRLDDAAREFQAAAALAPANPEVK